MKAATLPQDCLPFPTLERAAALLRVLGHPQRLRIVELLSAERMSVGELTERLGLASNAVSQHLNIMKAHGILTSQRDGRTVHYRVDNPQARSVLRCIHKNAPPAE